MTKQKTKLKAEKVKIGTKPAISLNNMLPAVPSLVNIVVLGKFTDGKVRQILTTKNEQLNITHILVQMSKDGKISAMENTIDSLGWESDIDLRT